MLEGKWCSECWKGRQLLHALEGGERKEGGGGKMKREGKRKD